MKFIFESDMKKGECYMCPMCKEREIGSICAIDDCLVSTIEDSSECPLMEANEVVWHPFPQEKPTINRRYLVTTSYGTIFIDNWWKYTDSCGSWGSGTDPIAWAELPAPYKEEDK